RKEAPRADVIYKTRELVETASPAADTGQEWAAYIERQISDALEPLTEAIGKTLASERAKNQREREKELAVLRTEISELKGQLSTLTTLFGTKAARKTK